MLLVSPLSHSSTEILVQVLVASLQCLSVFRCHNWKRRRQRCLSAALGLRMSWELCRRKLTRMHRHWLQRKQSLRYTLLPDFCQCHHVDLLPDVMHSCRMLHQLNGVEDVLRCKPLGPVFGARRHSQSWHHSCAELMQNDYAQAVKAELTQMPSAEPEKAGEDDMENLMSALGQESEKVDKLVELLQERGFDPTDLLTEVGRPTTSLSHSGHICFCI